MKATIQERLVAALLARGSKEVPSKSRKFRTFTNPKGGFYFLGKSGAMRFGRISSKTLPVADAVKRDLLKGEGA